MNFFRYKVISTTGRIENGIVQLPYQEIDSAIVHLERSGAIALSVKRLGPLATSLVQLASFRFRRGLARPDLAEMLSNVALMLSSGIPLISALEEAAQSAEKPELRADLTDMIQAISSGMTFSEAVQKYRRIFPNSVVHLIRMGEETGQLDRVLKEAAGHLKRIHGIVTDTKQALLYPGLVIAAMTGGMIFWFYYVVPKIIGLFREMDVALPAVTRLMISLSEFVRLNMIPLSIIPIIGILGLIIARHRSRSIRYGSDALLMHLPIVGTIVTASNLAFITEYFALLLKSGIDILQSVAILKDSLENEIYRDKMSEIRETLSKGEGVSDAFRNAAIFPAFVVRMINVGEMSGTLTEQLDRISTEYRNKLSVLVATIGKLIEPVVLVVAGGIFAVMIAALLLPIYDLIGRVSG
jgi:general secretion pathway protein F/type IV pilus assembly protein PilC